MILTATLATTKQRNVSRIRLSFLGLLVGAMTMMPAAVNAQGVGPDQDSLLPPEVVPLDPSAIGKTSAAPVSNQAASNFGSAPGLSNGSQPAEPTQSAQDFRKAYFDSLNQAPVRQLTSNPNLQMMQAQMGQFPTQQSNQPNPLNPNQFGGNAPGSAPGLATANSGPMQSQTLSGGVKDQNANNKPSKLAKAQHSLGLATSFGAAGLGGMRSGQGMYSLGLMGVSLINYGMRNGLSHF